MWTVWAKSAISGGELDQPIRIGQTLSRVGLIAIASGFEPWSGEHGFEEVDGIARYNIVGRVLRSEPPALLLLEVNSTRVLVETSGCPTVERDLDVGPLVHSGGKLLPVSEGSVVRVTAYLEVVDMAAWEGLALPEARRDWVVRGALTRDYTFGRPSMHSEHLVLMEASEDAAMARVEGTLVLVDLSPLN